MPRVAGGVTKAGPGRATRNLALPAPASPAPAGPGPSCCLCHRLSLQPWASPFALVSSMVGAENIQILLPMHWHRGLDVTVARLQLSLRACKAQSSRGKGNQGSLPWVQSALILCPTASCVPHIPVHGLLQGTGAPAPSGRDPQRCHDLAEKETGDVAKWLLNIQTLGFPAAKTPQVPAVNDGAPAGLSSPANIPAASFSQAFCSPHVY